MAPVAPVDAVDLMDRTHGVLWPRRLVVSSAWLTALPSEKLPAAAPFA